MDQAKEYLRIAIKYRFWIVVGIAALMPLVGYYSSAGSLNEETKKATEEIKSAREGVKTYESGTPVNSAYKPAVEKRTEGLTKDVNVTWRKLYERQAPLMTWPEPVEQKLREWGRKWPEGVDPRLVQRTIIDYVETYEPYVHEVYLTVKPYDPKEDKGIVAVPPEANLLMPETFSATEQPTLGKVWAAQERLWTQRTILDVVAKVNDKVDAKDWETAVVKQIVNLDVGTSTAIDQKSYAKGAKPVDAPDILSPEAAKLAEAEKAAESSSGGGAAGGAAGGDMQKMMMKGGMGMAGAGGGGMMGAGAPVQAEPMMYIESPHPDQYFIIPFALTVYVDQDHIPDLVVEFQNSPIDIKVFDFEMNKPPAHTVKKPKPGDQLAFGGGGGGMMGGMMSMMKMRGGAGVFGGNAGMMRMMMGSMAGAGAGGYGRGGGGDMQRMMMRGAGGTMGMGGGAAAKPKRQGEDVSKQNIEKLKKKGSKDEDGEKKKEDEDSHSIVDPYYNIVEVTLSGQTRFYREPPKEPAAESTSLGDAGTGTEAKPDAKAEATKPGESTTEKTEATKPDEKTEPKADEPKADDKKAEAKSDESKADEPKADEPKADEPKADDKKAEAKPSEPAPGAAPKTDDKPSGGDSAAPK